MRLHALAVLALVAATPAFAAEKVWTDAPVPGTSVGGTVAPADRAGQSNGPDNASPFSGVPSGSVASGGSGAPTSRDLDVSGTPNVSR